MIVNVVVVAGFLTRDPELRYTPKGTAVCSTSLALNRVFKNEAGESREETTFIEVDIFGKPAEAFHIHFKKGKPVLITGRLRQDSWEDKTTGQKRSKIKVVCENWSFVAPAPAKTNNHEPTDLVKLPS